MVVFSTNLSVLYTGNKKKRKKKEALCLLSVPAGARAHLCRSLEVNWILKGEKYWEIGGSDAESGMILAKGGPVYSCYCYGGDELIWYLALINDEGLCGLNLKAASGHFYAAGLYFSRAHPPHLSHDGFTASGFHFKDVFIVKEKEVLFVVFYYILLFDNLNDLLTHLCGQVIKL